MFKWFWTYILVGCPCSFTEGQNKQAEKQKWIELKREKQFFFQIMFHSYFRLNDDFGFSIL